jgi:capsid portal protein
VEPPLDLADLAGLLLESTDFSACAFQIAADTVGLGYDLEETETGKVTPKDQMERDRRAVNEFFENAPGGQDEEMAAGDETLEQTLTCSAVDWESGGNGYIEISRDEEYTADGLYHLQGTRMRIRKDRRGFAQISPSRSKVVWFRNFGSPKELGVDWPGRFIAPDEDKSMLLNEVLWVRHYHPASFFYGLPRIVPAISAVRGNTFSADRNIKFFYNKALPEIAILVEGNTETVGDEDMQAFIDEICDHFMTELQGEHFKPLILQLPQGITIKIEKMSPEMKDADHRTYRIDNRDEILRAHNMMPNRLGIIESGNLGGGTGESQIEIYKQSVTRPRQGIWNRKLTRVIELGLGIKTLRFKLREIDTIDESREALILQILVLTGTMTVNEARKFARERLQVEWLEKIEDQWADLPLPVIQPQLALLPLGLESIEPVQDPTEPVGPHAPSLAGGKNGLLQRILVDDAYKRLVRKVGGRTGGNGAGGAVPEGRTRTSSHNRSR